MAYRKIFPMGLKTNDVYLDSPGYLAQEKFDGTRVILFKDGEDIKMMGRSWKNDFAPKYPSLVKQARRLRAKSCIIDSELTFFDVTTGRDVFQTALATEETQRRYIVKLMCFDILEKENQDIRSEPLWKRLDILNEVVPVNLENIKVVETHPSKHREFFNIVTSDSQQGEGVVLKHRDSLYREGQETHEWIKVKKEKTADCVVVGVTEGTGVRQNRFGALVLGQYNENHVLKYVGHVGTGFTDSQLTYFFDKLSSINTSYPAL
jgi:bifunctional non-homologous end joining protein LigD